MTDDYLRQRNRELARLRSALSAAELGTARHERLRARYEAVERGWNQML